VQLITISLPSLQKIPHYSDAFSTRLFHIISREDYSLLFVYPEPVARVVYKSDIKPLLGIPGFVDRWQIGRQRFFDEIYDAERNCYLRGGCMKRGFLKIPSSSSGYNSWISFVFVPYGKIIMVLTEGLDLCGYGDLEGSSLNTPPPIAPSISGEFFPSFFFPSFF